jgi:adenosylhomocysteine nucleosidase
MPSELAPLKRRLDLQGEGDDPRIWVGRSGEVAVIATTTGMGTANAARATMRLLDAQDVDHVMVVGIAGGVGSTEVGAVIRPALVVDHASGAEYRPTYPDGTDGKGTLFTSDDFIVVPERVAQLVADGVIAVDMETAAIAAVCHERNVPWSVVRVISDLSSDHPDDAVLGMTNPDGTPNMPAGLRFMLRNPKRIPQLMRLARDATAAARTAAKVAADASAQLSAP